MNPKRLDEADGAVGDPAEIHPYDPDHVWLMMESFRRLLGRDLIPGVSNGRSEAARQLWDAPCFLASHRGGEDPVLNYGNRTALRLFGMEWGEFTQTPSRFTAEPENREERARMLERAARQGYIDDYAGIRISKDGRRFLIEKAIIWNLLDAQGICHGQAATFDRWTPWEG